MQSMCKTDSGGGISLSLAAARAEDPPDELDDNCASFSPLPAGTPPAAVAAQACRSFSPMYVPEEMPYIGPTVVPHHESSVRCVAHRFLQSRNCANAFLGMESGEILSLLDRLEVRGSRKAEMETEKLGDHKSPITALLIFRDTLISSDKDGYIRFWDVSDGAQTPRLRCMVRAAAQVNAMTVQSMSDILSSADRKFVCPRGSMLAACLPDALLFSGEGDAHISVWTLSASTTGVLAQGSLVRRAASYGATRALVSCGRVLVSASIGRMLCFWDTRRSSFETQLTLHTGSQVCSLLVLNRHVYGGCDDGSVCAWALLTGRLGAKLVARVDAHPGVPIRHLATMDASYLLTASDRGRMQAWRPADLKLLWKHQAEDKGQPPPRRATSFGRHPVRGRVALTRSKSSGARIWAAAGGSAAGVHRVRIIKPQPSSPIGLSLVSLGAGGTAVAVGLAIPGSLAKATNAIHELDVVLAVNGKGVNSCDAVRQAVASADRDVELVLRRLPAEAHPTPDSPFQSQRLSLVLHAPPAGEGVGVVLCRFAELSPIVSGIEPGSVAEASGVLAPGDVVLAVGGVAAGGLAYTTHLLSVMLDRPMGAVEILVQRAVNVDRTPEEDSKLPHGWKKGGPPLRASSTAGAERRATIEPAHAWLGSLEDEVLMEERHLEDQEAALLRDVTAFERRLLTALEAEGKPGVGSKSTSGSAPASPAGAAGSKRGSLPRKLSFTRRTNSTSA